METHVTCTSSKQALEAARSRFALDCFTVFKFFAPIPYDQRKADWPQCGACAASFYLQHHAQPMPPLQSSSALALSNLTESLRELACLRDEGVLDEEEFRVVKRRMLAV